MAASSGGEGDLAVQPGWISFWPVEDVMALNEDHEIGDNLPGFLGFGSDGGGELIAFDLRAGQPFPIVMIPFIPMEVGEARQIAGSFDEFRLLIGKQAGDGA
jgi:hypothetical protein